MSPRDEGRHVVDVLQGRRTIASKRGDIPGGEHNSARPSFHFEAYFPIFNRDDNGAVITVGTHRELGTNVSCNHGTRTHGKGASNVMHYFEERLTLQFYDSLARAEHCRKFQPACRAQDRMRAIAHGDVGMFSGSSDNFPALKLRRRRSRMRASQPTAVGCRSEGEYDH
jgi:hypothetical protein